MSRPPPLSTLFPYTTLFRSAPLVPVVKPQSAFFEMCGPSGMMVLQMITEHARELGLITILDSKRGDIASTAAAYADAAIGRDRKSTRLNSSHANISYAVFCL